jgi:uncharacterized protein YxeA
MKKLVIILGIILTSGIAALALSQDKKTETKTALIKVDRDDLASVKTQSYGSVKNNISNAD